jgi:hypothetical protein
MPLLPEGPSPEVEAEATLTGVEDETPLVLIGIVTCSAVPEVARERDGAIAKSTEDDPPWPMLTVGIGTNAMTRAESGTLDVITTTGPEIIHRAESRLVLLLAVGQVPFHLLGALRIMPSSIEHPKQITTLDGDLQQQLHLPSWGARDVNTNSRITSV